MVSFGSRAASVASRFHKKTLKKFHFWQEDEKRLESGKILIPSKGGGDQATSSLRVAAVCVEFIDD